VVLLTCRRVGCSGVTTFDLITSDFACSEISFRRCRWWRWQPLQRLVFGVISCIS